MASLENYSLNLINALEKKDFSAYNRNRVALVASIADNDFMVDSIQDYLVVGKALTIVLDDLSKTGLIYRRVVLTALYSLLKNIISDKQDLHPNTAIASAYLFIIYVENRDFIGAEYLIKKLRGDTDATVYQLIGMMCVFLWKFKLSHYPVKFEGRTQSRLLDAMSNSVTDIPNESTRKKVIDFEYENFKSMISDLPLDIELKYPGVPFFDPEYVFPKIQSMFKPSSSYFISNSIIEENDILNDSESEISSLATGPSNTESDNSNSFPNQKNNEGCLFSIIMVIIIFIISIVSLI